MFINALLVYLGVTMCFFLHYYLGNALFDRPIIVGTVVGALLGDIHTGILIGGTYELIFLGVTNAGGIVPGNTALGTSIGVALTMLTGLSMEGALTIAVPASLLGASLITLMYTLRSFMNPLVDKMIENADYKKIKIFVFLQGIIPYLIIFLPVFLVIYLGTGVVETIVNALPTFVTAGLSTAAGLLAAVGFGMLLKLTWTKSLCVYFFLGYVLTAYLGMPVLGVAIVGIIYGVILYNNKIQADRNSKDNEEVIFND